jgi:hypothetical protein
MSPLRVFLLALIGFTGVLQAQSPGLRDPEAFYVEGLPGVDAIILKIEGLTPVYATRNLTAHVGNFIAGEEVILIAHHPDSYLVRARKAKLEGWVSPQTISPIDPLLLKEAQIALEDEKRYQEGIKKREVIAGMTYDHVLKAIGKPENKSFRQDETGRYDRWSYVEYDTIIEQRPYRDVYTGQLLYQSVRVKIPVGSLDIEFTQGRVSALERTQTAAPSRSKIRLR